MIHPIVSTPDLPRLRAFYEKVLGAKRTMRVPDEGPEFYIELSVGAGALGIVQKDDTEIGSPVRVILSAEVDHPADHADHHSPAPPTPVSAHRSRGRSTEP